MTAVDPDALISPDFRYAEFLDSDTAQAHGITIRINEAGSVHRNLIDLVSRVMQPLRDTAGSPVIIKSGYRPPRVNKLVGGAPDSQHTTGEACDFRIKGMGYVESARLVASTGLPFDQLILEHDQHIVHVSHVRGPNRGQTLTRYTDGDTIEYVIGLRTEEEL